MATNRVIQILLLSILLVLLSSCKEDDSDKDGVPDDKDKCPTVRGPKQFNGCPDSDGDGIPDNLDSCPNTYGIAQYNGCPPPDRDGDGIPDSEDSCPDEAGEGGSYRGCPFWGVDLCSGYDTYERNTTGDGRYYLRLGNTSIDLYFSTSLPTTYRDAARYAAYTWSATCPRLKFSFNNTPVSNRYEVLDGKNVIAFGKIVSDPGAIGETSYWYNNTNGIIVEADIILSNEYSWATGRATNCYDVQSVLTHEFGHLAGLDEVNDRTQTMYWMSSENSIIYRTLCSGDAAGIRAIYP